MTEQEFQAELAKRDDQIRGLSTKLQAHERVVKELGDAVERDAYGNPVRILVEDAPGPATPASFAGGHPLSGFADYAGAGWTPNAVDAYYLDLVGKKGYLTRQEAEQMASDRAAAYANVVLGNAKVWRMHDKLIANPAYADLGKPDSELAKRTARILKERTYTDPNGQMRSYGSPMTEQAKGFDEWAYRDLGDLQYAADLAQIELAKESAAAAAAAKTGAGAQGAAGLSPGAAATAGAGGGAPTDVNSLIAANAPPEEVAAAMEAALSPQR